MNVMSSNFREKKLVRRLMNYSSELDSCVEKMINELDVLRSDLTLLRVDLAEMFLVYDCEEEEVCSDD